MIYVQCTLYFVEYVPTMCVLLYNSWNFGTIIQITF